MWIGQWAQTALAIPANFTIGVEVEETPVNSGTWSGGMPAESGTQCLTDILGRLEPIADRHPDERNLYYPAPVDEDAPLHSAIWPDHLRHLRDVPTGDHPESPPRTEKEQEWALPPIKDRPQA
jgi:hypothetical protein